MKNVKTVTLTNEELKNIDGGFIITGAAVGIGVGIFGGAFGVGYLIGQSLKR